MAWLEEDGALATVPKTTEMPPSSGKRPPRLPGAARTLPPMPVAASPSVRPPPRHKTMEVEMNWVELVDEKKKPAVAKKHVPIPREDE